MKKAKAELNAAIKEVIDRKSLQKEEIHVNDVHEYDYVMDNSDCDVTVHSLFYSNDDSWEQNTKNTLALQLVNTGNGVIITGLNTNQEIDYMKIQQLHILLRLDDEGSKFEICEPSVKIDF